MNGRRSGKSLLELLVAISILSSLLALAGRTFAFLMRADARGRKSVVQSAGLSRLANRFRRDVRAAKSAELIAANNENSKRLRLTMPDGRFIEYRPEGNRVTAVVFDGKKIRGRERYLLGDGETRVEISGGPPEIVSLIRTTVPAPEKRSSAEAFPRRTVRIEAVRGRMLRFTSPPGKPPKARSKTSSQPKSKL